MASEDTNVAPEDARPLVGTRGVDIVVSILVLGLAVLLGWDNWRIGHSWADDGPQAGYFPFYLSVLMGSASLYGLARTLVARRAGSEPFVRRGQFVRVMQMFVPTFAFCLLTQYLGLYVASFLLIAGFMIVVGKIAVWKSLLSSFMFTAAMFVTFEIAFNVIMPKGPLEAAFGY